MFRFFSHAGRSWKHGKGVAGMAVLALGIGIGATVAIYTVVQAVLLNPLPYAHPNRWLELRGSFTGFKDLPTAWAYPECQDFQREQKSLTMVGCWTFQYFNIDAEGEAVHTAGAQIEPVIGQAFGVPMRSGRWFRFSDGLNVAVISEALEHRAGLGDLTGRTVRINAVPFRVVGVMPAWFHFPIWDAQSEIWTPLNVPEAMRAERGDHWLSAVAVLQPGITLKGADAELKAITARNARLHPTEEDPSRTGVAAGLLESTVKNTRPVLLLLLAAAGALLLIACANAASLFLARSVARSRETAVRVAIGGSAGQLAEQYFAEGLAIALPAAVLGIAVALFLLRTLAALAQDNLPRWETVSVDWRVLAFTVAIAATAGILFSLAPLWQALQTQPNQVLTAGVRATASRGARRLLRIFVTFEIALSFALLSLAGMFLEHVGTLFRANIGFDAHHLTTFTLFVPRAKYTGPGEFQHFQTRIQRALERTPGVEAASFSSALPFGGSVYDIITSPDHRDLSHANVKEILAKYDYQFRFVGDNYFRTMRIAIKEGTGLSEFDPKAKLPPTVVSEKVAHNLWPGKSAIGHTLTLGNEKQEYRVVGVCADTLEHLRPDAYYGFLNNGHVYVSFRSDWPRDYSIHAVVRSNTTEAQLSSSIRRAIASVDATQPIFDVRTMDQLIESSLARDRLQSMITSFFAAAALLLSVLGLYGVVSYSVRQRLPEMGTRIALGATENKMLKLVTGEAVKAAMWGCAAGAVIVVALVKVLQQQHIQIADPMPYAASVAIVLLTSVAASIAPAWNASGVSPLIALGQEAGSAGRRLRRGYSRLVQSFSPGSHRAAEMAILSAVTESTRAAESFNSAIRAALEAVIRNTKAEGATLLVRRSPHQPFRCLSAIPETAESIMLPEQNFLITRLQRFYPGVPLTDGDLDALQRWGEEMNRARLPEIETLRSIGAAAVLPVTVKEEIAGILFVKPPQGESSFDPSHMRLLRSVSAQFALMLENSRLTDRIVEQERLRRDLALATEVQKRLFPERAPDVKTAQLAGFCLPARGIGGDLYDFLRLSDSEIGVAIADVAGKGIAAALVTSIIQASLRSLAGTDGDSPAKLAAKMNKLLCASTGPSSYATFFYAKYDEAARTICYANAGHNPPILRRANGEVEELRAGGMIVGMFPFATYEESNVQLQPGDVVLLYTDGVSEAHNPAEDEYGDDRLRQLAAECAHLPVDEMSAAVFEHLKAWMQDAPQHDDLTFVLLKVV